MTQYDRRDARALDEAGGHYSRHVEAMTVEGLHAKADIAAELAWRDAEIERLRGQVEVFRIGRDLASRMLADLREEMDARDTDLVLRMGER